MEQTRQTSAPERASLDAPVRRVAVLGSTGTVGVNALDVCSHLPNVEVTGLSGHANLPLLFRQAASFPDASIVASDPAALCGCPVPPELACRLKSGPEALVNLARSPRVDVVVAAIVGSAGLPSTLAAVEAGKTVALANKESLVVAGELLMPLARRSGATLLPVDSEHSGVLQCLASGRASEVRRIILTASGGPFRDWPAERLASVTPAEATRHPVWNMGAKISVDSATMMNKALEIVEAAWLFGLGCDQIEVQIHPQSLIHALVEFVDGSVIAQIGQPDMRLPVQYALSWPGRRPGPGRLLDWSKASTLELIPADPDRYPALELGREVVRRGGTSGAVLNAANETAVAAFLAGRLAFSAIVPACREILAGHRTVTQPDLAGLLEADRIARKETEEWIQCR